MGHGDLLVTHNLSDGKNHNCRHTHAAASAARAGLRAIRKLWTRQSDCYRETRFVFIFAKGWDMQIVGFAILRKSSFDQELIESSLYFSAHDSYFCRFSKTSLTTGRAENALGQPA